MGLSRKLPLFITCQRSQGTGRAAGSKLNDSKYNRLLFPSAAALPPLLGVFNTHLKILTAGCCLTLSEVYPHLPVSQMQGGLISLFITKCNL